MILHKRRLWCLWQISCLDVWVVEFVQSTIMMLILIIMPNHVLTQVKILTKCSQSQIPALGCVPPSYHRLTTSLGGWIYFYYQYHDHDHRHHHHHNCQVCGIIAHTIIIKIIIIAIIIIFMICIIIIIIIRFVAGRSQSSPSPSSSSPSHFHLLSVSRFFFIILMFMMMIKTR